MWFIYTLIILLIILVLIVIKSSILNLSILFLTKKRIRNERLLLPVIFSFISFAALIIAAIVILNNCGISITSLITKILLKINYSTKQLGFTFMAFIIAIIIHLFAEAALLKLVDLNYTKIFGNIRVGFKKLFVKIFKNTEENNAKVTHEENELTAVDFDEYYIPPSYFQYLIVSILSLVITLAFISISLGIGFAIGGKFLDKII